MTNFEECIAAGNPVMESDPRQCSAGGQTFTEEIDPISIPPEPVACTMEAKLCPDGSYVGRTGPNCEFTQCPTGSVETGSVASLNQKIISSGVYITPVEVVSDSRCPIDVNCFWAGEILVKIKLEKGDETNFVELKLGESASIRGSNVTFVSVLPEKNSKISTQASDYSFIYKVL